MNTARPSCREVEESLAAYVDGEITDIDPEAIHVHLGGCPPCRRREAAERAARELVCTRRERLRGCAPSDLRRRCAAHAAAIRGDGRAARRRFWVPLSLAASLFLVAGVWFVFAWGSSVETYAAQLAVDHVKCFQFAPETSGATDAMLMGRSWQQANGWPLKVAASSQTEHLHLIGIRRCGSTRGRVAHILYRWRDQPLSVYVLNGKLDRDADSTHDRYDYEPVARFGENAIIWFQRGRTYAVVSKVPVPDLQKVAGYVRRSIE